MDVAWALVVNAEAGAKDVAPSDAFSVEAMVQLVSDFGLAWVRRLSRGN